MAEIETNVTTTKPNPRRRRRVIEEDFPSEVILEDNRESLWQSS